VPFVFRKEGLSLEHSGAESIYYRLVGAAFMDGLVEPFSLDNSVVDEVAGRQLERFLIH